jgi:hydrogenase maturation protease
LVTGEDRGVAPVLVLAVGNVLLGDDGCGQRMLVELERMRRRRADLVELIDGGTQGLALLGLLAGRHGLLVLDAVRLGATPGTIHRLRGDEVFAALAAPGLTAHEGNAGELLRAAALLDELPTQVVVVGIEPGRVATGSELSAAVDAAVPAAARCAADELDVLAAAPGET